MENNHAKNITAILQNVYDERIIDLKAKIENVRQQIVFQTRAYAHTKDTIRKSFSDDYVSRVEGDKIFQKGEGEDFDTIYIQHQFGAVREWSATHKILSELHVQYNEFANTIQQLEQDKEYMNKTPAELYREILSLRSCLQQIMNEHYKSKDKIRRKLSELYIEVQDTSGKQEKSILESRNTKEELEKTKTELQTMKEELQSTRADFVQMKCDMDLLMAYITKYHKGDDIPCVSYTIPSTSIHTCKSNEGVCADV
jgi:hypothetical protein